MIEGTEHKNQMGFSSSDARMLTGFSKQVLAWLETPVHERRYKSPLSEKQWFRLKVKIQKYTRQLARIARAAEAREEVNRQLAA